jgi:hypothetical protein
MIFRSAHLDIALGLKPDSFMVRLAASAALSALSVRN